MNRDDDAILASLARATPEPPPLSTELEAELATLAPVTPRRPLRQLAVLVALSLVYGAAIVVALSSRRDIGELPAGWLVATGAAWLLGFVVPCYLALVPRRGAVMPRWRWAAASAIATAIGFVVLGLVVHPSGPSSAHHGWDQLLRGHGCLELGLVTALVPVILGALCLRGAAPVGSRWIAAALGAGGGSLGGLVLHLHCPVADGAHVGVLHGGVVVLGAVLAAALVPRATDRPLA